MLVRDCMTRAPIVIRPTDSMQDALELMSRKHIRHLPVVDEGGQLVGLVTDRDLRRAMPSPLFSPPEAAEAFMATPVERVMVRSPAAVSPSQPLKEAVQRMLEKKYGALLVMDGPRLVGILSQIDVLRAFYQSMP